MLGKQELETVVGVRPGLSSRRIVVMAHRDALGSPALAELSGTAALLEMARLFKVRELRSTLVLVSTSGGSAGRGGRARVRGVRRRPGRRRDRARRHRRPRRTTSPGSCRGRTARRPRRWRSARTLESAVRREVGVQAGGSRAIGQWARRALPLTVSEQGEAARAGLPAVLLQASGERGPGAAHRGVREPPRRVRPRGACAPSPRSTRACRARARTARSRTSRRGSSPSSGCCPTGRSGCWSGRSCCRRC